MSTKPMQRARVDGAELEFEVTGAGEPVLLIHGAFIAEAYAPLCAELALNSRYRLVRYHRRGYAGSSPVRAPFSLGQQAADCRALLGHLGIERAHVVGHSSGGASPCGWRSTRRNSSTPSSCSSPRCSTSQAEPCSPKRSGRCWSDAEPATRRARPSSFLRWAMGPDYRGWLDRLIPGAFQQLVADADTFFGVELPSLQEWRFTRDDARAITQPVLGVFGAESASIWPRWNGVQERLREWLPQTEPFVLAGSNHALEERDPVGIAEAMVPFLARHPMPVHA